MQLNVSEFRLKDITENCINVLKNPQKLQASRKYVCNINFLFYSFVFYCVFHSVNHYIDPLNNKTVKIVALHITLSKATM